MTRRLTLALLVWLALTLQAYADPEPLFSRRDPTADDFGAGSVTYPLDESFPPGVFDLTRFSVLQDDTYYYFRFEFAHVANPWNAPEGFYHPRIDVFIDATAGTGRTHPLRSGPGEVRFVDAHPWDIWLRVAPWDGAAVFRFDDPPDAHGLSSGTHVHQVDQRTIEAIVPREHVPALDRSAQYYVLVGSFDALGIDGYRQVEAQPSRWLLSGDNTNVRVVDLLAPRLGSRSQRRQLQPTGDGAALLHPVGAGPNWAVWALLIFTALGAATLRLWVHRRRT